MTNTKIRISNVAEYKIKLQTNNPYPFIEYKIMNKNNFIK